MEEATTHQHIDTLNNVKKDLILSVLQDTALVAAMGDLELVRFLGDVLLQDLALRRLWVSEIHHLIHELKNDDNISYTLFLQLF